MMTPSIGGGHAPTELPRGIPGTGDPRNRGSAQGHAWNQCPRALGASPLSALPERGPKDRGRSRGTARATSRRQLPGPGWGRGSGGARAGFSRSPRGSRIRRGSGTAEHVRLQLPAAAPAAPGRHSGGAGGARPPPAPGPARPALLLRPSCLAPSLSPLSSSPSPGPPMTFLSICKVTAALSRQDGAEATSALPALAWGAGVGGDPARCHLQGHAGPPPTQLCPARPGRCRAMGGGCHGHAVPWGARRRPPRTREGAVGRVPPPPLRRLAQDQKELSIPAPDLSPMTPSSCETLPWQP